VADRFDRKKLAIAIDIIRATVSLGLLLVDSVEQLWIAYVVIVLLALGEALFGPAVAAAQPNLCKPYELATANALQQSTWASVSMLGAALGGLISYFVGREAAFLLNAGSFLISAYFLVRVRGAFSQPGQRAGGLTLHSLTEGARFLLGNRNILGISLVKPIWAFTFATVSLYSVFAFRVYNNGDAGTSALYVARGIGSFLGPVLLQTFFQPKTVRDFFLISVISLILCGTGYALWGLAELPVLGALGIFVGHLGGGNAWTFSRIYVQRETPDRLRGRVLALDAVGFSLITGVSAYLWGWVAARSTPAISVLSAVAVTSVLGLVWALWMASHLKRHPLESIQV
jgi:MFS family permease